MLVAASALLLVLSPDDTVGSPDEVVSAVREALDTSIPPEQDSVTESEGAAPAPVVTVPPGDDAAPQPETGSGSTAEADAQPVGLRIDAIDVQAPVLPYGVDQATRQMAVPDNVTEVAWYEFGPTPGAAGSAVLAAHVDLFGQGPGVFFELGRLDVDDVVHVDFEDGSDRAFRVIARTQYDKDELPTDVIFAKQGPAVLTLITCGGDFSRSDRSYDSNVVVYAVPIDGDEAPPSGTAD